MLIGLGHKKASGKDTVADYLVNQYGFVKMAFADHLKVTLRSMFGFTDQQLWGSQADKERIDPRWGFSPRFALQQLGEGARGLFGSDIWVKATEERIQRELKSGHKVVVTDVRHYNEAHLIENFGGAVVQVSRNLVAAADQNSSETEMDSFLYPHILENNSSKEMLYGAVDNLYEDLCRFPKS